MNRVIIDSNILVYFFKGNKQAAKVITESELNISAITFIEIAGYSKLDKAERELAKDFLNELTIIQTTPVICEFAAKFRLSYNIKTPDALIAATAKYLGLPLVTADEELFKIKEIEIIKFNKLTGI